MKIQWPTAGVLALVIIAIAALAGWGDRIDVPTAAVTWAQAIIGMIGAAVLAFMPKLLAKLTEDKDGDGWPDAFEQRRQAPAAPTDKKSGFATVGIMVAILVATLAGIFLGGCSPSALQVNATLASGAGAMIDTACHDGVEAARETEQRHAVDAYDTREAAAAAVAAVRDRWDPYVFACRILADAQNAWTDVLVGLVARGGQFSLALVLPPMSRFASSWDDFVALHPPMPDGIVLPTIDPSILAALATLVPTEGAE